MPVIVSTVAEGPGFAPILTAVTALAALLTVGLRSAVRDLS
jgi:hypothetical protein